MEPVTPENLHEKIRSAVVTFSDTAETLTLMPRKDSACLFFSPFTVGDDEIRLRLDWTSLDSNWQPTLDADFHSVATGKKRSLKGKRRDAHHTNTMPGDGRCYVWEFMDVSRHFRITVTWLATVSESLSATDSCSATVVHRA